MKRYRVAYHSLSAAHVLVIIYYAFVTLFATIGLVFQQAVLGLSHLFIFGAIALTQTVTGRGCPLTKMQNKIAPKIGKRIKINGFVSATLGALCNWHPQGKYVRAVTITTTLLIFSYYAIIYF